MSDIRQYIHSIFTPVDFEEINRVELIELMKKDKKNISGKINFTLLEEVGNPKVNVEVLPATINQAIDKYNESN